MTGRARGFTLVETLVALVVLSLGMLGAWALLLQGLVGHADAHRYAAATNLARDMADRIRANAPAGPRYASSGVDAPDDACVSPAACEPEQRAAADVAQFFHAARALLPGASASIEYEPATGPAATDRYAITLRWRGIRDDNCVTLHLLAAPVAG